MEHVFQISGEIEAVDLEKIDKDVNGITIYSGLRILDTDKNVRMVKDVIALTTVNSYIKEGLAGTFYFVKISKTKTVLFAYANEERKVYDNEDIKTLARNLRSVGIWFLIVSPAAAFTILFFGLGLLLTPICLYHAYTNAIKYPNMLDAVILEKYLTKDGFF